MTKERVQLIVGGLLHDVGKVVYQQGDGRKHSVSGYEFLMQEAGLKERQVLESVRYHHGAELENAEIPADSFAYITYFADNITAAAEHRKLDMEEKEGDKETPLESVFNILNGNDKKLFYHPRILGEKEGINFPVEEKFVFDQHFYLTIKQNLLENLRGIMWEPEYLNSILEILEGNLSYVPSSTAKDELSDVCLYDHLKLTAACNTCIYDYFQEKQVTDYKDKLWRRGREFQEEKMFALFSMDISGIQNFIYTIHSEGALRNLRARSFYLEIMMEHVVDTLLERLELSRANLIYSGGGHCYILMANTQKTKQVVMDFERELNQWLLEQFDISLFMASALAACSARDLRNEPAGSYADIFKQVGAAISKKKCARYTAGQIQELNQRKPADDTRECKVCKRLGQLAQSGMCESCSAIFRISKDILYSDFFVVVKTKREDALPLPFGAYLIAGQEESFEEYAQQDSFLRAYGKNKMYSGKHFASKIWVGDYTTGDSSEEFARQAEGVKRIGILRADVDNLGKAFVSGFESEKNGDKYVTLSRTAALSRQLSMFFKYHINQILKEPVYHMHSKEKKERKAAVVYSGGDDLFLVGAWDDVLELAIDIQQAFERYTEGSLSISAGIGIYQPKFPIHVSASEVAGLEEESKMCPGKNAVTILPDGENHEEADPQSGDTIMVSDGTYSWQVFENEVIGEKYQAIREFFQSSEDRGKSFLYHLLELVCRQEDKVNLARYVYLLAKMEPGNESSNEEKGRYKEFSRNMYQWIREGKDCRQLKTAINLYAYSIRDEEEGTW